MMTKLSGQVLGPLDTPTYGKCLMKKAIALCVFVFFVLPFFTGLILCCGAEAPAFRPDQVWLDASGQPIQAHGGGILQYGGTYFWFGENKAGKTYNHRVDVIGVSCYSSRDLYHWNNEGVVLPAVKNDPASDLAPSKVLERPKVVYDRHTKQFVMWMHVDTADYKYARAGVAVSNKPTGPYEYLGSFRPDNSMSRDLTVFQDDDGKAYLIFASEDNRTMHITRLSDNYLRPTNETARVFIDQSREAPAMFKHEGKYFLITSGCTGWAPNAAQYAVATSIMGPWRIKGNLTTGPGSETTFGAQSTFVLRVAGKPGAFIFLADCWNPDDLGDSRYVWLPIGIHGEDLKIEWRDQWDLSVFK